MALPETYLGAHLAPPRARNPRLLDYVRVPVDLGLSDRGPQILGGPFEQAQRTELHPGQLRATLSVAGYYRHQKGKLGYLLEDTSGTRTHLYYTTATEFTRLVLTSKERTWSGVWRWGVVGTCAALFFMDQETAVAHTAGQSNKP